MVKVWEDRVGAGVMGGDGVVVGEGREGVSLVRRCRVRKMMSDMEVMSITTVVTAYVVCMHKGLDYAIVAT